MPVHDGKANELVNLAQFTLGAISLSTRLRRRHRANSPLTSRRRKSAGRFDCDGFPLQSGTYLFADRLLEFLQVSGKPRGRTGLGEKYHIVIDPTNYNGADWR
jgi:hypothetical protein